MSRKTLWRCVGCLALEGSPHHPGCRWAAVSAQAEPTPSKAGAARPSWDDYFFDMARLVSARATCPRASIGCVIVDRYTHRVLGTGYNGAEAGEPHCTEVGCTILADHCVRAVHAEINAVEGLSPNDEGDLVAYVVGPRPVCSHCARTLHRAGVVEVHWRES